MSVGGVILTAVIVVIINTIISFIVANRFYKLTKKDSHIQSEIRALRRDIDDKFSGNIKAVREKAVKVNNSNPDYSGGEKIKPSHTQAQSEDDKKIEEFAKRWNIQVESDDEPEEKEKKPVRESRNKSSYQPKRSEKKQEKQEKQAEKKSPGRAKKLMGELFPFDEDN